MWLRQVWLLSVILLKILLIILSWYPFSFNTLPGDGRSIWTGKQKYFYLYLYVVFTLQNITFCNSFICKSLVFTRISNFFVPHKFTVAKIPSSVQLNNKPIKNPWLRSLLLPLIQCFLNFVVNILLDSILASSIKIFLDKNENIS